ncbi:hypothetical protein CHS0354_028916 [Potamilus streckersoni]|uniref:Uncharacterized protein n=1 Tax=Potamilus streckersoni TaxID=2493646 RepID=A0AAE0SJV7_9BIVA|nr:hypothetical protein CHS0354_028916 [Potamilus streckersoni]
MATGRAQSKFHDLILAKMNKDEIYLIVKNDTFINLYGHTLLDTVGVERKEEISNKKLLHENRDDVLEKPPLTEDVEKLSTFCQQEIKNLCDIADRQEKLNEDVWRALNVYLLCRLTSFNARRGGECAKLPIHVEIREEERQEEDYELIIEVTDKLLAKRLNVCYISGNGRKKVPIILTPDVTRGIRIKIRYRAIAGIFNTNKFVFAAQKSENGHIRDGIV